MSLYTRLATERRARESEETRVANARGKFLGDPTAVDSFVSKVMRQQLPPDTKVQTTKFATKVDAVDAGFSENDPRRGLGATIKNSYNKALTDPRFQDLDPRELLANVTAIHLEDTREATQQYTREQGAALLGGEKVRPRADYGEWLAQQQSGETAQQEAEGSVSFAGDAPRNAALGAGFGAAGVALRNTGGGQKLVKALAKPLVKTGWKWAARIAGRGLVAAPHPLTKIAGAALLAIPEFWAFEKAGELVQRSEWGQANKDSAKVTAAALVAELGAGVGAGVALHKGLRRGLKAALDADIVSQSAKKQLAKSPTAKNMIVAHEAEKRSAAADAKFALENPAIESAGKKAIADSAELGAANEAAAMLNQVAPLSRGLEESSRKAVYEGTKKGREKAAKQVDETIVELRRIAEETGVDIPAIAAFEAEANLANVERKLASVTKKLNKATKKGDTKNIAAFEEQLVELEIKVAEGRSGFETPNLLHDGAVKQRQLAAIEKDLGSATPELQQQLLPIRERIQADIDNIIADNMAEISKLGDDAMEASLARIASGESPLVATSGVRVTGASKKYQANKTVEEKVKKLVEKNIVTDAKETVATSKLKEKAKSNVDAAPPSEALIAEAKLELIRDREMVGKSAVELEAMIVKRRKAGAAVDNAKIAKKIAEQEARPKAVLVTTESGTEEFVASSIKYGRDNPPPFMLYKEGKLTAEEYAATQLNNQITKAETDLVSGTAGEKLLRDIRQEVVAKTTKEVDVATKAMNGMSDDAIDAALPGVGSALRAEEEALARDLERGMLAEDIALEKSKIDAVGKAKTLKKVLAIAGPTSLGILAMDGLSPEEADASILSGVLGSTAKLIKESIGPTVKEKTAAFMKELTPFASAVERVKPGQKTMPTKTLTVKRVAPDVGAKIPIMPEKSLNRGKIQSMHYNADDLYPGMENPSVVIAEEMTAGYHDTEATQLVLKNILGKLIPRGKKAFREIRNTMRPLEEKFTPVFGEISFRKTLIEHPEVGIDAQLKSIEKRAAKGIDGYADQRAVLLAKKAEHEAGIETAKGNLVSYQAEHEALIKPLAGKHPTVRIALGAEGYEVYPWLRGMLSFEEEGAVAHLKGVMQEYGARIEAVGGKSIKSTDFMHHAMHPDRDFGKLKGMYNSIAGDVGSAPAFAKFHSRAFGSRQMVPDVDYIMERYLPDANKRIRMMSFWNKQGWEEHSIAAGKWSPAHKAYWNTVKDGFRPQAKTTANAIARNYTSLEVFRLLAASPSVAAKHLIKVSASMAQFDPLTTIRTIPKAVKASVRIALNRHFKDSFGRKITLNESEQAIESFIKQSNYSESIADMLQGETPVGTLERFMSFANEWGAVPVRSTELFDRAFTVIAGVEMAAKKGMTVPQARHAVFKTIMNNNFLGGVQNPAWLRDPKIRAMMLFQGTPFKIAERRLDIAIRSGRSVNKARVELMRQIKADVKEGEKRFKLGLINDALFMERDSFGKPFVGTLMSETAMLGLLVAGGREAFNLDFMTHAFHLPIVKFDSGGTGITTTTNPVIQSMARAYGKQHDEDSDFMMVEFLNDYFRGNGMPATYKKLARLSKGDIPARYQDAKFPEMSYFWGVPAVGQGKRF